jgi:hypothetical protein
VALENIREERPEEYKEAYNNRMVTIRDKQWREAINKSRGDRNETRIKDEQSR